MNETTEIPAITERIPPVRHRRRVFPRGWLDAAWAAVAVFFGLLDAVFLSVAARAVLALWRLG